MFRFGKKRSKAKKKANKLKINVQVGKQTNKKRCFRMQSKRKKRSLRDGKEKKTS